MVPGLFVISFEDINLNFVSCNSNYDWMVLCVKTRDQMDVYWCLLFQLPAQTVAQDQKDLRGRSQHQAGLVSLTRRRYQLPLWHYLVTIFSSLSILITSFSETLLKKKKEVIDHVSWLALCLRHFAKTPKLYLPAKTDPRLQVGTNTCLEVSVTDCIKVSVPLVTSLWAHFQNSTNEDVKERLFSFRRSSLRDWWRSHCEETVEKATLHNAGP